MTASYHAYYAVLSVCAVVFTAHHIWSESIRGACVTTASDTSVRSSSAVGNGGSASNLLRGAETLPVHQPLGQLPAQQQPPDLAQQPPMMAPPPIPQPRPVKTSSAMRSPPAQPPPPLNNQLPQRLERRGPVTVRMPSGNPTVLRPGECPSEPEYFAVNLADSKSQFFQDFLVYSHFFKGVCGRTYVEIGAFDGVDNSNTFFFNKHMNWTGILVEANPTSFAKAKVNRPQDRVYHAAITNDNAATVTFLLNDQEPQLNGIANVADAARMRSFQEVQVPVNTFRKIFAENGVTRVDFFSLDVEGAEYIVLQTIDFDTVTICILVTENGPRLFYREKNTQVGAFLRSKGFVGREFHIDTIWVNPKCPEYTLPQSLL